MSKELKQFGKMDSDLRRRAIYNDTSFEQMSNERLEAFRKQELVECLIAYKKGAEKQVLAYLTSRGVDAGDIRNAGTNQIVLRGKQADMSHIAGALYVNAPDLITKPRNPFLTNTDNMGDVKLSPKGVPFDTVLKTTANLVDSALRGNEKGMTAERFAEFVDEKRLGMLTSGADFRETAMLSSIACNIEDRVGQENFQQKLGKLKKSGVSVDQLLKDGGATI